MATIRPAHSTIASMAGLSLIESSVAERLHAMSGSLLFDGISRSDCTNIALSAKSRVFSRHDVIFMEGQAIRQVLLIQSGCVKLTQVGQDGSEVILWMKARGELAGGILMKPGDTHTYSAQVVQNCSAMVWDATKFDSYLDEFPSIRKNLSTISSAKLAELEQRFREVATQKVERRIANILIRLIKKMGTRADAGVAISLSREELAQMTGTTLFTVSRLMSEWEQQGFISPRREALLVRDIRPLAAIAGSDS